MANLNLIARQIKNFNLSLHAVFMDLKFCLAQKSTDKMRFFYKGTNIKFRLYLVPMFLSSLNQNLVDTLMNKKLLFSYTFILLLSITCISFAETMLEWDINADADYYIVHWGTVSRNSADYEGQSSEIPRGTTQYALSELELSQDIASVFLAVKAYNICGNSSGLSEEIVVSIDQLDVGGNDIDNVIYKSTSGSGGCFMKSLSK